MRTVALDPGGGADTRPVQAGIVTGGYFALLGVAPTLGRLLTPADDVPGAPLVAVLSHALWTEMGGPRDVLGTELRVNGATFRVVGVAPAGFEGLQLWGRPAFWMSVESWPAVSLGRTPDVHRRSWGWIAAVGRKRSDVGMADVVAEVHSVGAAIAAAHPENDDAAELRVVSSRRMAAGDLGGVLQPLVLALACVVALSLLAAAANVANLLLARAVGRQRELGIRVALGADRFRLGRLLAVESGLLVVLGAVGGFALSAAVLRGLATVRIPGGPSVVLGVLRPDARLLALGASLLVLVTTVVALTPAVTAARTGARGLAANRPVGGGRTTVRLRAAFAAAQVAVGVTLLAGTVLFGRSIVRALRVDVGFDAESLGVVRMDGSLFRDEQAAAAGALTRLVEAIAEQPGVVAASWATVAPLTLDQESESFDIVGRPWPGDRPTVEVSSVGAGFFRAAGIPLVRARPGALEGRLDVPVVVVNETMARRFWTGEDPVGSRIEVMGAQLEVVAVAADTRFHGFASEPVPLAFGVLPEVPSTSTSIVLRGGGVAEVLRSARELAHSVDGRLVVADVSTGPELVGFLLAPQRVGGLVFLLFALLALALALTGVYGVVAYGVGARAREFGVRLTRGAAPRRVVAEVLRANVVPVLGGILAGAAASVVLTRVASSFLFGVTAGDPLPAALASGAVLAMALLATWIPARRAGRVDPATVLTVE
jgi:predicted permease